MANPLQKRERSVLESVPESERQALKPMSDDALEAALARGRVDRTAPQANAQVTPVPARLLFR